MQITSIGRSFNEVTNFEKKVERVQHAENENIMVKKYSNWVTTLIHSRRVR